MKKCYSSLRIHADEAQFQKISDLLGLAHQEGFHDWSHLVIERDDVPSTFISDMMTKIEKHASDLAQMGVEKDGVALQFHYEYDSQMNMEFDPETLYRIGKNDVTMAVTCQEVEFVDND